jgi:RNA recognition motif-containing protein
LFPYFKFTSLQGKSFRTSGGLQVTVGNTAKHIVRIVGLHNGVQSNDVKDIFDKYGFVNYAYVLHSDNGTHLGIGQACFAKL